MNDVYSVIIDNVKMRFILNNMSFVRHDSDNVTGKPYHAHTYYELLVALDDGPCVVTSSQRFELKKNVCAVILPETLHKTENSDNLISIGFRYNKYSEKDTRGDLFGYLEESLNNGKRVNISIPDEGLREILDQIHGFLSHRDFIADGMIISALLRLLYSIISVLNDTDQIQVQDNADDTPEDILRLTDAMLNQEFSKDIKAEDVADMFHISCKQLNRYFQKLYGLTFMQRRTELRLEKAKKLLKSSDMPIKDISDAIGYNSVNTFYSAFKVHFCCSPEAYKNGEKTD